MVQVDKTKGRILVVDDEASQRHTLAVILEKLGYWQKEFESGQQVVDYLQEPRADEPDLVLLDVVMPEMDGLETLKLLRELRPDLPVIILTAHGKIDIAVNAMKIGAADFLVKPVTPERLRVSIENALRINMLSGEILRLQRKIEGQVTFTDLIGTSEKLEAAVDLGLRAASSDIPVLIEGESGTGKEMFARAIHGSSERAGKPFIAVNCGALPDNLVESILFGHEKGSFTGAMFKTIGKFREAEGGTIFLDEVGDLKPELQVKLLRALQNGEIEPVGAKNSVSVNVRIISATHRNLETEIAAQRFRDDLYYRLSVFPISIPPLRERENDIEILIDYFLRKFASLENKRISGMTKEAEDILLAHPWPGNIRQLENALFRAVVLCDEETLAAHHFTRLTSTGSTPKAHSGPGALGMLGEGPKLRSFEDMEREILRFAMEHHKGNMSAIARELKLGRSTLYRKAAQFKLG